MTDERIHATDQGQVRVQLRQTWRDGTTDILFDPVEFLGRLAVLVPRPRINLLLYHGVLGPRAAWRSEVVPCAASEDGRDVGKESATEQALDAEPAETARRQARGQCWASLMARTFGFDVLACPRCGGRLHLIALIKEAAVIERILRHLGVPTEIPAPRPAARRRSAGELPIRLVGTSTRRCSIPVPDDLQHGLPSARRRCPLAESCAARGASRGHQASVRPMIRVCSVANLRCGGGGGRRIRIRSLPSTADTPSNPAYRPPEVVRQE